VPANGITPKIYDRSYSKLIKSELYLSGIVFTSNTTFNIKHRPIAQFVLTCDVSGFST